MHEVHLTFWGLVAIGRNSSFVVHFNLDELLIDLLLLSIFATNFNFMCN